ncbi:MAG: transcriptional regulator [Candidatus Bathyarchaeota archaeon]|nr:transcriptional regulator [Candidatus Bathyarchaeota archaeon]MDH5780303.1 transcriptional regulator [Candidatus Bathyarchaeota archaeon]
MVSKDQAIGWLIFLACAVVAIVYLVAFYFFPTIALWLVGVPVVIAFIAVLAIGAWIGWTMATTPPPKPIEEIEAETRIEEKEEEEEKE